MMMTMIKTTIKLSDSIDDGKIRDHIDNDSVQFFTYTFIQQAEGQL
jgi:hypothetical protein